MYMFFFGGEGLFTIGTNIRLVKSGENLLLRMMLTIRVHMTLTVAVTKRSRRLCSEANVIIENANKLVKC